MKKAIKYFLRYLNIFMGNCEFYNECEFANSQCIKDKIIFHCGIWRRKVRNEE